MMAFIILQSQGSIGLKGDVDLTVEITDDPDPVKAGSGLTYTVLFTNAGKREASTVVLATGLHAGVEFVSSTPGLPSCRPAGAAVTCNLGNKLGGSEGKIRVHVMVDPETTGTITYTATIRSEEDEPNTANNAASQQTTVN